MGHERKIMFEPGVHLGFHAYFVYGYPFYTGIYILRCTFSKVFKYDPGAGPRYDMLII